MIKHGWMYTNWRSRLRTAPDGAELRVQFTRREYPATFDAQGEVEILNMKRFVEDEEVTDGSIYFLDGVEDEMIANSTEIPDYELPLEEPEANGGRF